MTTTSDVDKSLEISRACVLITDAGTDFGYSDVTTAKAMLLYHYYGKVRSDVENFFQLAATATFHLSASICEEDVDLDKIVKYFEDLGFKSLQYNYDSKGAFALIKSKVLEVENEITRLVFGMDYQSPKLRKPTLPKTLDVAHRFVLCYMDQFAKCPDIMDNMVSVKTASLKLINTFYLCPKSTTYTPLEISWAAMCLAFQIFCIDLDRKSNKIVKQELDSCVDLKHLQDVKDDILVVIEVAKSFFDSLSTKS